VHTANSNVPPCRRPQALCDELPAAAAMFKRASEILGYDLLDVCVNGPKEKLDSTVVRPPPQLPCPPPPTAHDACAR
jgi:hypothetical protein